jgi:hypothetical protein
VVAEPDAVRGEVLVAFVARRAGFEPSDDLSHELQELVKRRLAAHTFPRRIYYVDTLPKTPSDKIQRFALRERQAGGPPDGRLVRALEWLRAHQDGQFGFWAAVSMNKRYKPDSMQIRFMQDAAYLVCGPGIARQITFRTGLQQRTQETIRHDTLRSATSSRGEPNRIAAVIHVRHCAPTRQCLRSSTFSTAPAA